MIRDERVDSYIASAQPFARPVLEHLRCRIHGLVPGVEETLKWGMPAYTLNGKILIITAAFKEHLALNFWRGQELRVGDAKSQAMGQFGRIRNIDDLPPEEELDRLIGKAVALSKKAPTRHKAKPAPKGPPQLHPDFAAALADAPNSRRVFDNFPPSAQRDYAEWIAEAKQVSTRHKRIAAALEWLSEGKRRNWKYEKA